MALRHEQRDEGGAGRFKARAKAKRSGTRKYRAIARGRRGNR